MLQLLAKLKVKWNKVGSSTRYVILVLAALLFILTIVVITIFAKAASRESVQHTPLWEDPRLPTTVKPKHYNIILNLDVTHNKFWGKEEIQVEITNRTSVILLHARNISITKVGMYYKEGDNDKESIKISRHHTWTEHSYYVIYLRDYIRPDEATEMNYYLELEWSGTLQYKLQGLYLSDYTEGGETKKLVSSQMQATAAREAIPCFDEPEFKAVFDMTIQTERNYSMVRWNTDTKTEEDMNYDGRDWKKITFDTSPVMPSYLLAFVVANFDCVNKTLKDREIEGEKQDDILLRVCGRPESIQNGYGAYALNASEKIITYFEEYYNQAYPLSKCDNVAVPDFQAGAMENWGLIIYREQYLFYNSETDATSVMGSVNLVVAHELAHMWFGNLVTMKWWNDVWLNEGFATYVQGLGSSNSEPTWDYPNFLIKQFRVTGMERDAYTTSRPASVTVTDPDNVHALFDQIAYNKGASLLAQLNMIMGMEGNKMNFQEGVKKYLEKYQYSNANQSQLYAELDEFYESDDGLSVEQIMNTWTLQMNFPVVSVGWYDTGKLILSQKRFVIADEDQVDPLSSPYNYQWYVPIKYKIYDASKEDGEKLQTSDLTWIKPNRQLVIPYEGDSIFVNWDGNGFYVTAYSKDLWENLVTERTNLELNSREKQILLYDTYLLAEASYYPLTRQLDLLKMWAEEPDFNTAQEVYRQIGEITNLIKGNDTLLAAWEGMWASHTSTLYDDSKGQNDEGYVGKLTKSAAMTNCLRYNDLENGAISCISDASAIWESYKISADNKIDVDYMRSVLSYAVSSDTSANWEKVWEMYSDESRSAAEQTVIAYALAQTTDDATITQYISYCMDSSKVRTSNGLYAMGRLIATANQVSAAISLDYLLTNWPKIYEQFKSLDLETSTYITSVISQVTTEGDLKKVTDKFESDPEYLLPGIKVAYYEGIENAKANINWLISENKQTIDDWISKN